RSELVATDRGARAAAVQVSGAAGFLTRLAHVGDGSAMTKTMVGVMTAGAAAAVILSLSAMRTDGQAQALRRTSDGKPDLNGIWQVLNTASWDIQDHDANKGVPAGQGVVEGSEIPYKAWAAAKRRENSEERMTRDPLLKCYLPGVPRITYMPFPFEITQTPKMVGISYEYVHGTRLIYTDGSKHPEGLIDFWMGDSRGRWEGDTLVVDVTNFNGQTWFDRAGNFHSDALHVIERYRPVNND